MAAATNNNTKRQNPQHFTFSTMDFWTKKRRRDILRFSHLRRNISTTTTHNNKTSIFVVGKRILWLLLLGIFLIQFYLLQKVEMNIQLVGVSSSSSSSSSFHINDAFSSLTLPSPSNNNNNNNNNRKERPSMGKPRILIGIFSDRTKHTSKQISSTAFRRRYRKLFKLWSDKRLCSYNDYIHSPSKHGDCQVLYTFVLAAYPIKDTTTTTTTTANAAAADTTTRKDDDDDIPTMVVIKNASWPLEVIPSSTSNFSLFNQAKDFYENNDFTLLNIRESMNHGKTPTFFFWARGIAKSLNIQYVAKCDSDAIFRLVFLLQCLHKELPWQPPPPPYPQQQQRSLVLGTMRHKAFWNDTRGEGEEFWHKNYYHGMHLYLGGQFYLISTDLIDGLIQQAKHYPNLNYLEGHEDHDALSMIQVAKKDDLIRWISLPRNYRFWGMCSVCVYFCQ